MNPKPKTATIALSLTDRYGERWEGDFEVKLQLSAADYLKIDAQRRTLIGDAGGAPDPDTDMLARALAWAGVVVVDAPDWWKRSNWGRDLSPDVALGLFDLAAARHSQHVASTRKAGEAAAAELRADRDAHPAK